MTEADWLVIRRSLKLNWRDIAKQIGVSERNLRRYRRGELPTPTTVQVALEGLICRQIHQHRQVKLESAAEMALQKVVRKFVVHRN